MKYVKYIITKLPLGGMGGLLISLITGIAMASCKSKRSVVESETNANYHVAIAQSFTDSMAMQRLFTFDELDYWISQHYHDSLVTDSGTVPQTTMHVRIIGGRASEEKYDAHKAEADLKSAEVTESKTNTKMNTKAMQYTYINYFVAGIMVLLSLIGPLHLPQRGRA